MSRLAKIALLVGAVAAVALIGVLFGWLGTKRPETGSQEATSASPPATPLSPTPPQPVTLVTNPPTEATVAPTNPPEVAVSSSSTNLVSDWPEKLDAILGGDGEVEDKAKRLFELFPQLPKDGQAEVAQHLSNLVADKDYAELGKLLADPKMPESVLDVLMGDVLNRANSVKLPELLEVARDPDHPKAAEAKDILQLYLEQDYGTDWTQWQAKVEQWLKDNPD